MTREINQSGLELIKEFEGFKSRPYLDHKGIPTIGIGTIRYPNGMAVSMLDKKITLQKAYEYLRHHVHKDAVVLEAFLDRNNIELNDNQFSALLAFGYNVGIGAVVGKNRLLSKALRSKDPKAIEAAILAYKYVKLRGKKTVVGGLLRRRRAEVDLYHRPDKIVA